MVNRREEEDQMHSDFSSTAAGSPPSPDNQREQTAFIAVAGGCSMQLGGSYADQ